KDTGPVGVATQNPVQRQRYHGQADHVVNFFAFMAEEERGYLAQLGFRSLDDAIGADERLRIDEDRAAASGLDLDLESILTVPTGLSGSPAGARRCAGLVIRDVAGELGLRRLDAAEDAIVAGRPVRFGSRIENTDRSAGTLLGHYITRAHGGR